MLKEKRIEFNPKICNGKPIIRGTRIPVSVLLDQIAEGISWETILADYPELEIQDIKAALHYASSSIDHTEIREINARIA